MEYLSNLGGGNQMPMKECCDVESPSSVLISLEQRKNRLEKSLSTINDAIAALKKNPELVDVLDKINKAARL